MVEQTRLEVADRRKAADGLDGPHKEQIGRAADEVLAIASEIEGKLEADLEAAAAAHNRLAEAYAALSSLQGGQVMGRQGPAAGAPSRIAAAPADGRAASVAVRRGGLRRLKTVDEVRRERRVKEGAVILAGTLIALVVGTKVLWVDDMTWGGPSAWIAAVLWGLGLHQVSGIAFDGLEGQLTRLTK